MSWRRVLHIQATPERVLATLDARAADRGLPPPAALAGDWFGSRAIIAPSVDVAAVDPATAYTTPATQPPTPDVADDAVGDGFVGGGWIGYLGYDLIDPSARNGDLPPVAWGWTDAVLRQDVTGRWWYECLHDDGAAAADQLEAALSREVGSRCSWTPVTMRSPDPDAHVKAVQACIEAIADGELFQANICTRFTGRFDGGGAALFAEGLRRLRPRRAAFVSGHWGSVVSLSPELFLARHGDVTRSTPIKGTLPRTGPADDGNAELLRRSDKDIAENVMITDLVRNDLGRVSAVGSVAVADLLSVTPAPGVWHLESTITSRMADGCTDADLLAAAFPPGSITGAPKLRALELIATLESWPRGVYCGAVGLVSPVAGMELNVAIRTFEIAAGRIALGVGGGITACSDPDSEWHECQHKAAPLQGLLAQPPDTR